MAVMEVGPGGNGAAPVSASSTPMLLSRDTLRVAVTRRAYACFSCGSLCEVLPREENEGSSTVERRCASCRQECAVPVEQALAEGWVRVVA